MAANRAPAARRKPAGSVQISGRARVRTPASGPVPCGNQREHPAGMVDEQSAAAPDRGEIGAAAAKLVGDPLRRRRHLLVVGLAGADLIGRRALRVGDAGDGGEGRRAGDEMLHGPTPWTGPALNNGRAARV